MKSRRQAGITKARLLRATVMFRSCYGVAAPTGVWSCDSDYRSDYEADLFYCSGSCMRTGHEYGMNWIKSGRWEFLSRRRIGLVLIQGMWSSRSCSRAAVVLALSTREGRQRVIRGVRYDFSRLISAQISWSFMLYQLCVFFRACVRCTVLFVLVFVLVLHARALRIFDHVYVFLFVCTYDPDDLRCLLEPSFDYIIRNCKRLSPSHIHVALITKSRIQVACSIHLNRNSSCRTINPKGRGRKKR